MKEKSKTQKVRVVIDDRESNIFLDLFSRLNCFIEFKRIAVGDFVCSERTVVERKSRSDFESSILDMRLFHQLENLKSNYKNVVIIVEGIKNDERISHEALMGAYAFLLTNGVSLFFTRDKKGTAEIIYSIAKHEQVSKNIAFSIKSKRKTNNLSQTQRSIVESFPMIGPKLAKSLLERFGSLDNLILADEKELLKVDKFGDKKVRVLKKTIKNNYISDEDPL